jgi:DNA-binding response OmpR family regulator
MLPRATVSAAEARAWLREGREFEVALIDTKLGDTDGYRLAAEFRRLRTAVQLPVGLPTVPGETRASAQLGSGGGGTRSRFCSRRTTR